MLVPSVKLVITFYDHFIAIQQSTAHMQVMKHMMCSACGSLYIYINFE